MVVRRERIDNLNLNDISDNSIEIVISYLALEDLLSLVLVDKNTAEKFLGSSALSRYIIHECCPFLYTDNSPQKDVIYRCGSYSPWLDPKSFTFERHEYELRARNVNITISKRSFPQIHSVLFPFAQLLNNKTTNQFSGDDLTDPSILQTVRDHFDSLPPFTSCTLEQESGQKQLRLTCICYFEVQFNSSFQSLTARSPLLPQQQLQQECFLGLTNSYQNLTEIKECLEGTFSRQNGRMTYSQKAFIYDCFNPFQSGDIMGCGIVYPPLSRNPYGQIIFTRNGELIHIEDFKSPEGTGVAWYPFVVTNQLVISTLNFGRDTPWKFNLQAFEQQLMIEKCSILGLGNESFYKNVIRSQEKLLRIDSLVLEIKLFHRIVKKWQKLQILRKDFPNERQIHGLASSTPPSSCLTNPSAPVLIIACFSAEQTTRGSTSNLTSFEPDVNKPSTTNKTNGSSITTSSLPSVLKNGIFYRNSSFDETSMSKEKFGRNSMNSVVFDESFNQSIQVTTIPKIKSDPIQPFILRPSLQNVTSYSSMIMEDDPDWCEDSMAVELSSVDSMAVNEMRDCGISAHETQFESNDNQTLSNTQENASTKYPNQIKFYLHSTNQFNSHYHQELLESIHSHNHNGNYNASTNITSNDSVAHPNPFSPSLNRQEGIVTADSRSTPSGTHYTALADAKSVSDWLKRANEIAITSNTSMRIDFQSAASRTDSIETSAHIVDDVDGSNYDSEERSIATSLFVEVDSVDEDGSYLGYGAACEEQENDCDDEEYIQGRLSKTEDTLLFNNRHDSDSGQYGARWMSSDRTDYPISVTATDPNLFPQPEGPYYYPSSSPATSLPRRKRKLVEATFTFPSNSSTPTPRTSPQLKYARKSLRLNSRKFLRSTTSQSPHHKSSPNYYSEVNCSSNNTLNSLPSLSLIGSSTDIPPLVDGEDGYDGASERGRCDNDVIDDCITDNELSRNYDAIEKEEISFTESDPMTTLNRSGELPVAVSPDGSERREYGSARTPSSSSTLDQAIAPYGFNEGMENHPIYSGESSISSGLIPPHHRVHHRLRKSHSHPYRPPS